MPNNTQDIIIQRTLQAPIQKVWDMWATSDGFKQWYGPEGAVIPTAEMDVRVNGKRHICMEMNTPNGPMQMWFVGEYLEVTPNTKLVYTESMSDADGNVMSPAAMGMPEGSPDSTTVTVELTDNGESTEMTMTHTGVPAGSPGEMGWNMALDKLSKLLG